MRINEKYIKRINVIKTRKVKIRGYEGIYVCRDLKEMPMAMRFGNELLNPVGFEIRRVDRPNHPGEWWNVYENTIGETWLGR